MSTTVCTTLGQSQIKLNARFNIFLHTGVNININSGVGPLVTCQRHANTNVTLAC